MIKFRTLIITFVLVLIATTTTIFALKTKEAHKMDSWNTSIQRIDPPIPLSTYTNSEYGFSFAYANKYVVQEEVYPKCIPEGDPSSTDFSFTTLYPSSEVLIYFLPEIQKNFMKEDKRVFNSGFYYKISPCLPSQFLSVVVRKKRDGFDLPSYMNYQVSEIEKNYLDQGLKGNISIITEKIGNKILPVVRVLDGIDPEITTDFYFFENRDYVFILGQEYSKAYSNMTLKELSKKPDAVVMWLEHKFANEVISKFDPGVLYR